VNQRPEYSKHVDTIRKDEFISLFLSIKPEEWFSETELKMFTFPGNAGSLAGRYLIKKTICNYIKECEKMYEIEILNDELGKPKISFGMNIRRDIELAGIKNIYCSISHSKNYIAGMTIFSF
jgi:phosphopantetheinyl transferase (holo-ACP synthase)